MQRVLFILVVRNLQIVWVLPESNYPMNFHNINLVHAPRRTMHYELRQRMEQPWNLLCFAPNI
jgi:hypothetical protein